MMEFYEVDIFTMKREEFGNLNKGVYERRARGCQTFEADSLKIPQRYQHRKLLHGTADVSYLKEDKPFVHLSKDKNHSPHLRMRESPQSFI